MTLGITSTRPVGTAHTDGGIEVLLHRRLMDQWDSRGNDTATVMIHAFYAAVCMCVCMYVYLCVWSCHTPVMHCRHFVDVFATHFCTGRSLRRSGSCLHPLAR